MGAGFHLLFAPNPAERVEMRDQGGKCCRNFVRALRAKQPPRDVREDAPEKAKTCVSCLHAMLAGAAQGQAETKSKNKENGEWQRSGELPVAFGREGQSAASNKSLMEGEEHEPEGSKDAKGMEFPGRSEGSPPVRKWAHSSRAQPDGLCS